MPDNDYNIIKPVETLPTVADLTPTKRREQRKRRQNLHEENDNQSERNLDEAAQVQNISGELTENEEEQHTIDYHA